MGVGGEYPIASSSASERAEADASLQQRRGETVMLTFSMQGTRGGPRAWAYSVSSAWGFMHRTSDFIGLRDYALSLRLHWVVPLWAVTLLCSLFCCLYRTSNSVM